MNLRGLGLVFSILLMSGCLTHARADESILSYFMEIKPSSGKPALFIRRDPIVVAVAGLDPSMNEVIKDFIIPYAEASSLPIKASNEEANFIILKAEGIIQDGNLKPEALIKSGLSPELVSGMTKTSGWPSGCVPYVFPNAAGSIAIFVGLIDASLDHTTQERCITEIATRGFGIGIGESREFPLKINVFKYAYVLNIVTRCDKEQASVSLAAVKRCIAQQTKELSIKDQRSISSHFDKLSPELEPRRDKPVLFIRKDPIVMHADGFEPEILKRMGQIASIYAKASSLPISFSKREVNLAIFKTHDVNQGDYVNTDTLKRLKIPPDIISAMSKIPVFSSGCGLYNFSNRQGYISGTVALVDTSLDADKQEGCVSFVLLSAFGFGSKLDSDLSIPRPMNVSKNAHVLNIVASCDDVHATKSIESVTQCIDRKASTLDLGEE